ncbi:unnamed protein product, partial [Laminaria digitata]
PSPPAGGLPGLGAVRLSYPAWRGGPGLGAHRGHGLWRARHRLQPLRGAGVCATGRHGASRAAPRCSRLHAGGVVVAGRAAHRQGADEQGCLRSRGALRRPGQRKGLGAAAHRPHGDRAVLKKVLLSGVALIPIGLARLGFNAVSLRAFGEHTTGELNVALSLGMALALPVSAAFGPSVLRFVAFERGKDRPDVAGGVLTRLLIWGLLFEILTAGLAYAFRNQLPNAAGLSDLLFFGAVAVGISYSVYLVLRNGLYAVDRVATYTGLELLTALLFFGSLAGLVLWAPSAASLLAFLVGYTSFILGALFVLRTQLR